MPKISVIVPAFNAEAYLQTCIDSVSSQLFSDFELLLIDDGSTDATPAICQRAAALDRRVRAIRQDNAGVSAARNRGIDLARGEYITFLDADDAYDRTHLSTLLALAESTRADVSALGARSVWPDGRIEEIVITDTGVFQGKESILRQFLTSSGGLYCCWNKLFRAQVLEGVRFRPYTWAEDALFCVETLLASETYAAGEQATYIYNRRPGSVTMTTVKASTADRPKAWREIVSLLEKNAPSLRGIAAKKLICEIDKLYPVYKKERPEGWRECCRKLKSWHQEAYLRQFPEPIPARAKIASMLYSVSPSAYYFLAEK